MTAHSLATDTLLAIVVLATWVGVLGMWRMPEPMQALHYIAWPASLGAFALSVAVFVETGFSSAAIKTLLIALILFAINSIVAHATARAFRTRDLGHWEPRAGDPMEFVPSTHHPGKERAE